LARNSRETGSNGALAVVFYSCILVSFRRGFSTRVRRHAGDGGVKISGAHLARDELLAILSKRNGKRRYFSFSLSLGDRVICLVRAASGASPFIAHA
jgi:hypothetical protein